MSIGFVAAIGFSVGLFFCAAILPPGQLRSEMSMGVLLSLAGLPLALIACRIFRVGRFAPRPGCRDAASRRRRAIERSIVTASIPPPTPVA